MRAHMHSVRTHSRKCTHRCMNMYTHIQTCMPTTHAHMRTHVHMHARRSHVYIPTSRTRIRTQAHMLTRGYIPTLCTQTHTYMLAHAHTVLHTHMCVHTCTSRT